MSPFNPQHPFRTFPSPLGRAIHVKDKGSLLQEGMNSHMPCEQRATKEINLQVVGPKCAVHQQGAAMPMLDQQLQHAGLAEHHLKRLVSGAVLRLVVQHMLWHGRSEGVKGAGLVRVVLPVQAIDGLRDVGHVL
jgi:hypothetical protein